MQNGPLILGFFYEELLISILIQNDARSTNKLSPESSDNSYSGQVAHSVNYKIPNNSSYQTVGHETTFSSDTRISGLVTLGGAGNGMLSVGADSSLSPDSFGTTHVIAGSPESVDNQSLESSLLNPHQSFSYDMKDNHHHSPLGQIFNVTDISPSWALSTEETKVYFQ